MDPKSDALKQTAPKSFQVRFETSKGPFAVEVTREWAPRGADRFYNLVRNGFYDECRFFRVLSRFVAQIGINGDPKIAAVWENATIKDDPVVKSNRRGFVTYAMAGPNTRTTQIFFNFGDNIRLDEMGFAPFGKVIEGLTVLDSLHADYGEGAPQGSGPRQDLIALQGNAYLEKEFPKLDYVQFARVVR